MAGMQPTRFRTVAVRSILAGQTPRGIARGTDVPVRALVKNISGTNIFLAGASQDVGNPGGAGSASYALRPDESEVFVLAPGQVLYAGGNGIGGVVSVSESDAIAPS
jgi:hypothetical protein